MMPIGRMSKVVDQVRYPLRLAKLGDSWCIWSETTKSSAADDVLRRHRYFDEVRLRDQVAKAAGLVIYL